MCAYALSKRALISNARLLGKGGSNHPPKVSWGIEHVWGASLNRTARTLCRGRRMSRCHQVAIGDPVSGNFQLAMYSLATMHELDGAPQLMGY